MEYERDLPLRMPPPFGANGRALMAAIGKRLDVLTALFRDAVHARMPGIAPTDALALIGQERQIPQATSETAAAYSARLLRAWDIWGGDNTPSTGVGGGAGSPLGMLNALKAAGFPMGTTGATIVQQCGRPAGDSVRGYAQLDTSGNLVLGELMNCVHRKDLTGSVNPRPGWTFNAGKPNFYSIFGLVFGATTAIDTAVLHAIVKKWRPSKALFCGTWVITAGRVYGWPTGRVYGADGDYGGDIVTFYPGPDDETAKVGYYHLP